MAVNAGILKVVVSFYRIDSETAHKRHRSRIPINNVNTVLELKKHLILFLGLQELSSKSPCLSSCNDSTRSTGLSGTVSFLQVHGSIYNGFVIRAQMNAL